MEFNKSYLNGSTIKDFAYWIGVAQTDGYLQIQKTKDSKIKSSSIVLGVGEKSLPMLNKFMKISRDIFGLSGHFYSRLNHIGTIAYVYTFGCKRFITSKLYN